MRRNRGATSQLVNGREFSHNTESETSSSDEEEEEEGKKSGIVAKILDVRLVDDELEFLCSIQDESEPRWVHREECQAGQLIQQFFDNRARQCLAEDSKSLSAESDTNRPSTSALSSGKTTQKVPELKLGSWSALVLLEEDQVSSPSTPEEDEIECLCARPTTDGILYTFKQGNKKKIDITDVELANMPGNNYIQQALVFTFQHIFDAKLEFRKNGVVLQPSDRQMVFNKELLLSQISTRQSGISTSMSKAAKVDNGHINEYDDVEEESDSHEEEEDEGTDEEEYFQNGDVSSDKVYDKVSALKGRSMKDEEPGNLLESNAPEVATEIKDCGRSCVETSNPKTDHLDSNEGRTRSKRSLLLSSPTSLSNRTEIDTQSTDASSSTDSIPQHSSRFFELRKRGSERSTENMHIDGPSTSTAGKRLSDRLQRRSVSSDGTTSSNFKSPELESSPSSSSGISASKRPRRDLNLKTAFRSSKERLKSLKETSSREPLNGTNANLSIHQTASELSRRDKSSSSIKPPPNVVEFHHKKKRCV